MQASRAFLVVAAVAAVLALAVVAGSGLRDRGQVAAPATASPTPTASPSTPAPTPTVTATATPQASPTAAAAGAIAGRFGYGSDFIPPVTVYAISTTDSRLWYSVNYIGLGRGRSATPVPGMTGSSDYLISGVAPGTYWVVAYRNDGESPDPGYHSQQAVCGRTSPGGPCPNINPVPVTVTAGETSTRIDILTWGTQPQPSTTLPPRPR